ncbi:MAG: phosphotransferase family protein [Acetatifactor sp.]
MITKNIQTKETILRMAKGAFPEKEVKSITELTEGMCNVAYRIVFHDDSESILKIAAKDRSGNTSNEIGLMEAEVTAMQLVREHTQIPVAKVYRYDTSRTLCDGDYFFMEKMPGESLSGIKYSFAEEELAKIYEEIGRYSKQLTAIENSTFGMLGDERRFHTLYDFVRYMLGNLIYDAKNRNIDILFDGDELLDSLASDQWAFETVEHATLVHWDMWEGNVFVENGRVSGIIDWERAMWGEPFMDDRFRYHSRNQAFLTGFGQTEFSETEKRRLRWYDIILYLTMMIEVFYRGFEDDGQYRWAGGMLKEVYG